MKWHLVSRAAGETDITLDDFMAKLDPATLAEGTKQAQPWLDALKAGASRAGAGRGGAAAIAGGAGRQALMQHCAKGVVASPVAILNFDADDAREAGDIRAALERAGTPIRPYEISSPRRPAAARATLVTANAREFARVPGLAIQDWAAP